MLHVHRAADSAVQAVHMAGLSLVLLSWFAILYSIYYTGLLQLAIADLVLLLLLYYYHRRGIRRLLTR